MNISNCGKIIIDKVTVPDPDPSDTEFPMTLTGGPASQNLSQSFSLTNDDPVHDSGAILPSGSTPYVAAETTPLPEGWQLDSATCVDTVGANSTPAAIDLSAGETVTCTFTNSKLETNISTEQSFIPKDTATITGSPPEHFNGTVDFRLFSGSNCGNNTDALFEDLGNQLNDTNSGVSVTTDNDGTADAGTKNGYTITGTGGTFSWKVNYTHATGEVHPDAEYCHEDSTVTIDNDDTQ